MDSECIYEQLIPSLVETELHYYGGIIKSDVINKILCEGFEEKTIKIAKSLEEPIYGVAIFGEEKLLDMIEASINLRKRESVQKGGLKLRYAEMSKLPIYHSPE